MTTQRYERVPEWSRGDRFRKARNVTGLTVKEFAIKIGISAKSVNNYEGDHVAPRRVVLNAWALATGVPVEWLELGIEPSDGPDPDGGQPSGPYVVALVA